MYSELETDSPGFSWLNNKYFIGVGTFSGAIWTINLFGVSVIRSFSLLCTNTEALSHRKLNRAVLNGGHGYVYINLMWHRG